MAKYKLEVHLGGNRYSRTYESAPSRSVKEGYRQANGLSKWFGKPWTYVHIGKVEPKKKKGGLPF